MTDAAAVKHHPLEMAETACIGSAVQASHYAVVGPIALNSILGSDQEDMSHEKGRRSR